MKLKRTRVIAGATSTLVLVSTFSLGTSSATVPGLTPMAPKPGSACTERQIGTLATTKEMSSLGLKLMCVEEESHDHVGVLPNKESATVNRIKAERKWIPYGPPISPKLTDWLESGKGDASLAEEAARIWPNLDLKDSPKHKYDDPSLDPCRMGNGAQNQGMRTFNLSYGDPGLEGRDADGFMKSYGTVTVGVNAVYPKDSTRNGDTVTFKDGSTASVSQALQNIETRIKDVVGPYFYEQSYGKLRVEVAVVPIFRAADPGGYTQEQWDSSRGNYAWDVQRSWRRVPSAWMNKNKPDVLMTVTLGRNEGANTWDNALRNPGQPAATSPLVGTFPASGDGLRFSGALSVFSGADGMTLTHEIGHAMREQDQYESGEENEVQRRYNGRVGRLATIRSTGFLGWERYIHRWIDDGRVTCLPIESFAPNGSGVHAETLLPIQRPPYFDEGRNRLIVIPLPEGTSGGRATKGIVVESWRPIGTDAAFKADPNGGDGLLVYMVDANGPATNGARGEWPLANGGVALYREDHKSIEANQTTGPCASTVSGAGAMVADRDAVQLCVRRDAFLTQDSFSANAPDATYKVTRASTFCRSGQESGEITISLLFRTEDMVARGATGLDTREPSDTARVEYQRTGCI